MNYTQEEISKSVKIIKDICKANNCFNCPFGNKQGYCNVFGKIPLKWNLENKLEVIV